MRPTGLVTVILFLAFAAGAQQPDETLRQANNEFRKGDFTRAGEMYASVLKKEPANTTAKYNLGLAIYRQDSSDAAAAVFEPLTFSREEKDIRAASFYNRGVIFSKQNKLEESIEAWKNTLRLNPEDTAARENLQKALMELKKRTPPKKENKKPKEQPKKQPPKPKMNQRQMEQKMKELEEKEKEAQQKLQKKNSNTGTEKKDW